MHITTLFTSVSLNSGLAFSSLKLYRTTFSFSCIFFLQAEDGIRDTSVTVVQTCALPILSVYDQVANDFGSKNKTTIAIVHGGLVLRSKIVRALIVNAYRQPNFR